jgi:hypothetical protein
VDAHRSGYERLERETTALKNRVRGDETAFFKTRIERAFLSVSAERASGARGDALVRAHEGLLRDAQKTTETLRELDSNAGESNVGLTLDQMGSLRDVHRLIETRLARHARKRRGERRRRRQARRRGRLERVTEATDTHRRGTKKEVNQTHQRLSA